ncbi:IclR family transcriptional regulator (plasmid) [Paroceanicella profunda]|uniref:IclR family transcriptional regulator n=1 Tax=Paroceanicella profunda TaxID=2579971 RepID=A0A5B8G3L6_9RHOB|nr:IclR family transcriptional regulator [Paroceanicella profunda]QDL93852.1 IclR family transcriptional regulator [Paroceanicella profunda]
MNEKRVKSADRVLDLLEYLSAVDRPVALHEVVRDLGFPKSSAHGLIGTLVDRGYVVRDDADRFQVVDAFREGFGWVGGFEARLKALGRPVLEDARARTGETVFLAVPNGQGDAKVICKAVSLHHIRYDVDHTAPSPGYATVMGRVLLAFDEPARVDAYFARTELRPHTGRALTSEAEIRAVLARIRAEGYGSIEEEYASGGCGIAAPVRDRSGRVVAVLDIATVSQRYAELRPLLLETVRDSAARLSRRLGHNPASEEG